MKTIKTTTRALVTVQIDIHVGDTWGDDCTLEQIHSQATTAAVGFIRKRFDKPAMPVHIVSIDAITTKLRGSE